MNPEDKLTIYWSLKKVPNESHCHTQTNEINIPVILRVVLLMICYR